MADRVLSTVQAKEAIAEMERIINSDLLTQIDRLNKQGEILSDPNVWDGRLAAEFRNNWPQTYNALKKAQQELEQLRQNVQKINQNIMMAGGNS